ncbi:MAG: AAA family ATPase, partial [Chloroflexi bacterium]|nr:AAA family ATPase [Chloroflexota bacterium]
MAEVRAALNSALANQGRLVMLVGEPGAGKTKTSQQIAGHAENNGARVLWGRCHETPGAPPYWPWVQIIRNYLAQTDADSLAQILGVGGADVAEIVPELREMLPDLESFSALDDPDQARFRLFDSITNFLKRAAEQQPMVLFLEDLHWADKPSLLLLEFLGSEIADSPVMLVGNYRDIELTRQHPLSETLAELTREPHFMRVELRGLSRGEVSDFIAEYTGDIPVSDLLDAIHARTDGNPLFVNEVVRLLSEEGGLNTSGNPQAASLSIPVGVKDVIGKRLNRLSDSCSQTLTMASVIGREFGIDELTSLVDHLTEERLIETLDEAVAARVIEELPQEVDRYQFSHVLTRETLYEELTGSRRARLHRRIGEAMEELYSSDLESHVSQLAYHFSEARHSGSADKASDYARQAGDRNLALLAYEEASRHYEVALQNLRQDGASSQEIQCELLLSLGEARRREGAYNLPMESFEQAFMVGKEARLPEHAARAAIGYEDSSWRPGLFGGPAASLLREAIGMMDEENSVLKTKATAAPEPALLFSRLSGPGP